MRSSFVRAVGVAHKFPRLVHVPGVAQALCPDARELKGDDGARARNFGVPDGRELGIDRVEVVLPEGKDDHAAGLPLVERHLQDPMVALHMVSVQGRG